MSEIFTVCDICGGAIDPSEAAICEVSIMSQPDKDKERFEEEYLDICMPCQAEIFDFIKEKQANKGKP